MKTWQEVRDSRTPKGEEWRVGGERFFFYPEAYAYQYIAHLKPRRYQRYPNNRFFKCAFVVIWKNIKYWIEVTNNKDKGPLNRGVYFILLEEKKDIIDKLVNNEFVFLNGYREIDKLAKMFPYEGSYLPISQREVQ